MKKLLLLLILSFFSAQGYAGSCPDGSEPVKSVSDDGTYFVYNCGINTNKQASSSAKSITKFSGLNDEAISPEIPFDISSGYHELRKSQFSGIGYLTGDGVPKDTHKNAEKSYALNIVEDIVRAGKQALRFEVRSGDCGFEEGWQDCPNDRERVELAAAGPKNLMRSGEYWFAWSLYLPEDHQNLQPIMVHYGQFHQWDGPVAWMFSELKNGYNVVRTIDPYDEALLISNKDFVGKWNDILINANWSKQDDGFFKIWVNDQLKYDYKGPTFSGTGVYHRFGIYRSYVSGYINYHNITAIEECFKEKGSSKNELAQLSKLKLKKNSGNHAINLYNKCKDFYDEVDVPTTIAYFDEERRADSCEELGSLHDCSKLPTLDSKTQRLLGDIKGKVIKKILSKVGKENKDKVTSWVDNQVKVWMKETNFREEFGSAKLRKEIRNKFVDEGIEKFK